jgi:hypothetical protein
MHTLFVCFFVYYVAIGVFSSLCMTEKVSSVTQKQTLIVDSKGLWRFCPKILRYVLVYFWLLLLLCCLPFFMVYLRRNDSFESFLYIRNTLKRHERNHRLCEQYKCWNHASNFFVRPWESFRLYYFASWINILKIYRLIIFSIVEMKCFVNFWQISYL